MDVLIITVFALLLILGFFLGRWQLRVARNSARVLFAALIPRGLATLLICGTTHCNDTSGDGVSAGVIVNVGRQGVLWKLPTLYLVHVNEVKAEPFGLDPSLVDEAQKYAASGERVEITYESA